MADGEIRIEYIALGDLARWPGNPRKHNLELLGASHRRFGFVPGRLLIDETTGRLVAGHGNVKRLEDAHFKGEKPPERVRVDDAGEWLVPVLRGVAFKNEAEAEAFLLADNRTAEESGWHTDPLAKILGRGIDLTGIGWGRSDVAKILASSSPVRDDGPAPDKPDTPVTKPGDVWVLGRHRLLCGDSSERSALERLFGTDRARLAVTSPPLQPVDR